MTDWTEPVDVVAGEQSDADAFNAQVHGNLRHLYEAKACTLGRSSNLVVPHDTNTAFPWDFATLETASLWSLTPYPERITPSVAGLWLFTVRIQWPPTAGGARRVRMEQDGVVQIAQQTIPADASYTTHTQFTAMAQIDGLGAYVNVSVYQSSGGDITLSGGHRLDAVWLGAV